MSPTTCVQTLTAKQQGVAKPLVEALARLAMPIPIRDRHDYERRVLEYGAELNRMRRTLEAALSQEDERLRTEGTTDDLDDRWIRNLHRLEVICDLLDQAKAAAPSMKARAA